MDLAGFLEQHEAAHVHVRRSIELGQVGALTAQAEAPIVFHDIQSFPGWRLADQLFVDRRSQADVLECEPSEVVQRLARVLHDGPRPLTLVEDAACHEIVVTSDDVDLGVLPVVTHTDCDPYPYTTSFAVHRDPETGATNQMFPRCGVLSPNEMVSSLVTSTARRIFGKYQSADTKMPQAIVIGCHPAWELAATYSHPHEGWCELELFESITHQRGEVVACRTVDLMVPADASVVIEGYIDPERTAQDGPSPGPTMLFTPYASEQPVFEVTAITMQAEPIYRNHLMTPWTDHQELPRLFHEAIIYERLRALGVGARDVHFPPGGGALICVIQVDPTVDGQVTDALLSTLGATFLNMKMVIAVDPDVDIYDPRDVQFAVATRVDPSRDVIIVPNARGWVFDPSARVIEEAFPTSKATRFPSVVGKWGIDATKPVRYRSEERASFERAWPPRWGEVLLADFLD